VLVCALKGADLPMFVYLLSLDPTVHCGADTVLVAAVWMQRRTCC